MFAALKCIAGYTCFKENMVRISNPEKNVWITGEDKADTKTILEL